MEDYIKEIHRHKLQKLTEVESIKEIHQLKF